MSDNNWVKIFQTRQLVEAKVVEALLKEHELPVFIINKQDSSYGILLPGWIEIYTTKDQEWEAINLINT